jgi:DNA-binding NtrC family response regulator
LSNTRTILVAEDEFIILVDLADQLRSCGYRVIECLDAAQAIAVLASREPVDLVFSDIQMPGPFDGHDLAHWVARHRPEVRVILTSGDSQVLSQAPADTVYTTVPKPYVHKDLFAIFASLFAMFQGLPSGATEL